MKIAVFSDIHGNPAALDNVLEDAKEQGCERLVCLGDIVGYGYDPSGSIERCRANGVECILGNHDAGLIGKLSLGWFNGFAAVGVLRHRGMVSEDDKAWLKGLPYAKKEEFGTLRAYFSHGEFQVPTRFGYINSIADAEMVMSCMEMMQNINLLFVGHTHYAETYALDCDGEVKVLEPGRATDSPDLSINLKKYNRAIVNVGSVGYPRNQYATYYVVFDTVEQMIRYRELPFDIDSYETNMQKNRMPLPRWLLEKYK